MQTHVPEELILDLSALKLADSSPKVTLESFANVIYIRPAAQSTQADEPDAASEKEMVLEHIEGFLREGEEDFSEKPSPADPASEGSCTAEMEAQAKTLDLSYFMSEPSMSFSDLLQMSHEGSQEICELSQSGFDSSETMDPLQQDMLDAWNEITSTSGVSAAVTSPCDSTAVASPCDSTITEASTNFSPSSMPPILSPHAPISETAMEFESYSSSEVADPYEWRCMPEADLPVGSLLPTGVSIVCEDDSAATHGFTLDPAGVSDLLAHGPSTVSDASAYTERQISENLSVSCFPCTQHPHLFSWYILISCPQKYVPIRQKPRAPIEETSDAGWFIYIQNLLLYSLFPFYLA